MVMGMALVYSRAGEPEKSCEELKILLGMPSQVTIQLIRLDPMFSPVVDNPCFQELVTEFDSKI